MGCGQIGLTVSTLAAGEALREADKGRQHLMEVKAEGGSLGMERRHVRFD